MPLALAALLPAAVGVAISARAGIQLALCGGLVLVVSVGWVDRGRRVAAERAAAAAEITSLKEQLRQKARAVALANATLAQHRSEVADAQKHRDSSAAMSRAIVDHAAEGILAVESDGRLLEINPALQALLGVAADQVIGRPYTELFPGASRSPGDLAGETREILARRADGAQVPVALRLNQTRLAHQLVYVGLVRDLAPARAARAALDELNARLIDASRAAGRADVAASVLHNIGNILNSVNVSTSLLREALRSSEAASVGKVATLLEAQPDLAGFFRDDPRARRVPEFLRAIADKLGDEHATYGVHLDELGKQIDHVKAVIGMQEAHAGLSSVAERIAVQSVVDDALAINRAGLAKTGVSVRRAYDELPPFLVDRHRVLQILVNLLRNAQHAVAEVAGERVIEVRVARRGGAVAIQVCDNGVGIPAENLPRVFQQGFTTKSFGHGYGMHSSALAARAMGGSLSAASDGLGRGATMTLEIPIKQDEEVQRAA